MLQPIMSDCDTSFSPLGIDNREALERLQRQAPRSIYGFQPQKTGSKLTKLDCNFSKMFKGIFYGPPPRKSRTHTLHAHGLEILKCNCNVIAINVIVILKQQRFVFCFHGALLTLHHLEVLRLWLLKIVRTQLLLFILFSSVMDILMYRGQFFSL